jgi:thiamine biosynthesis lipoprotein
MLAGWLVILSTAAAPAAGRGDSPPMASVERARLLMGTLCTAIAEAPDTTRAARAISTAFAEIDRLEQVMSSWRKDSELSHLNALGGSIWFPCSRSLYAVIDSSLRYARLTRGAFDPTIEPFNRAWDTRGKGRVPSAFEIEQARILIGWSKVNLDRGERRVQFPFSDMGLDLGGIGKGYALDAAARLIAGDSVARALINFGGEVLAIGTDWEVAIADPVDRLKPAVGLTVSNAAVSTSSQSERGVVVKKKRYGHILDPRTGQPVSSTASVTVIACSATRADAISTALLVMGREEAAAFAEDHRDLGVLWLEPDGETVRAWTWNLPAARAEPGVRLEWMNR